jgi:hypothetical protein
MVPYPDLAQLHAAMIPRRQIMNQLPEIDPVLGYEVESNLAAVESPFHIDEAHGQPPGLDTLLTESPRLLLPDFDSVQLFCIFLIPEPDHRL